MTLNIKASIQIQKPINDVFENKSANLNLPLSQGNFKMTDYGSRTAEVLMTYRDGTTFLEKFKSDKGHLYLCAAPLEEASNLNWGGCLPSILA